MKTLSVSEVKMKLSALIEAGDTIFNFIRKLKMKRSLFAQ